MLVILSFSLHGWPPCIPWPSVSSHSTAGPQKQLMFECNRPLFSRAHGKRVYQAVWWTRLGAWAPCCRHRHCVYLMEMLGACLCDLETLRKPKGLATKKSLSPLCRSQLAPLSDNLTGSIFTEAKPQSIAGLNRVGKRGPSQEHDGGACFFYCK